MNSFGFNSFRNIETFQRQFNAYAEQLSKLDEELDYDNKILQGSYVRLIATKIMNFVMSLFNKTPSRPKKEIVLYEMTRHLLVGDQKGFLDDEKFRSQCLQTFTSNLDDYSLFYNMFYDRSDPVLPNNFFIKENIDLISYTYFEDISLFLSSSNKTVEGKEEKERTLWLAYYKMRKIYELLKDSSDLTEQKVKTNCDENYKNILFQLEKFYNGKEKEQDYLLRIEFKLEEINTSGDIQESKKNLDKALKDWIDFINSKTEEVQHEAYLNFEKTFFDKKMLTLVFPISNCLQILERIKQIYSAELLKCNQPNPPELTENLENVVDLPNREQEILFSLLRVNLIKMELNQDETSINEFLESLKKWNEIIQQAGHDVFIDLSLFDQEVLSIINDNAQIEKIRAHFSIKYQTFYSIHR